MRGVAEAVDEGRLVLGRGVGFGEIELNPRHPWGFQIQGPTWNTVLDVGALDVRGIKLDGGAAKVECFLPPPHGVVPIEVSGGVVGVTLHRPRGVAVAADVSTGAVRLRISGGAVQVSLDSEAKSVKQVEVEPPTEPAGESASALEILLDGVESRVKSRS